MTPHALSRADLAPAPARGVSAPLARLARRHAARIVARPGGSSAPTLDEAFAALDARRAAGVSETALPPFQSALERDAGVAAGAGGLQSRASTVTPLSRHRCSARPRRARWSPSWASRPTRRPRRLPSPRSPRRRATSSPPRLRRRRRRRAAAPAARVAAAAVFCVLGGALSAFLLACVPTLRAIANAADEIADLAASIREEVPDTLAAVRVSGMELTDCLEEVGELTHDVGSGIKGTGKAVAYTVDTAEFLGKTAASQVKKVLPEVKKVGERATPAARRALETASASIDETLRRSDETLKRNADTETYSEPVVAAAARATKNGVRYARGAIRAAGVAKQVGRVVKTVRGVADAGAAEARRGDGEEESSGDAAASSGAAR